MAKAAGVQGTGLYPYGALVLAGALAAAFAADRWLDSPVRGWLGRGRLQPQPFGPAGDAQGQALGDKAVGRA